MQKFHQPIALVYCTDNKKTAQLITSDLSAVIEFKHFSAHKDQASNLLEDIKDFQGPFILLISDNFLRTTQCMEHGLSMLSNFQDSILPVIIPGFRKNESGEIETISTDFSRFKQVVQYINYWQDRYLALRQQKRTDPDLNNEGFTVYLNTVRDIAGEAGQYLRTLQTLSPHNKEDFQQDSYRLLFDFLKKEELWEQYKIRIDKPEKQEKTEEEIILNDIPGISLLPEIDELEDTDSASSNTNKLRTETTIPGKQIKENIKNAWQTDYETGVEILNQSITQNPENIGLSYNLAVLQAQNNDFTAAETTILNLLNLSHNDEILFLAGEIAQLQGKTKSAIGYFEKVAQNNENYPDIFTILGRLTQLDSPKKEEQIASYFTTALLKNKKNSFATYELALLQLKNAEPKTAGKYLKKTLKLDPKHPFAAYDLALLLHENNSYKKAFKYYQKAISNNPELQTKENDIAFKLKGKTTKKEDIINTLMARIEELEAQLKA